MSLNKRGEIWHFDIIHKGKRVRGSTGTADKQEAQRIHDEQKADLWKSVQDGRTWLDAASAWLTDENRSIKDRYRLKSLAIDDAPITGITAEIIITALKGKSPGDWNRARSLIVAILNTAKARGWIKEIPNIPTKRVTAARIRFLSLAEWDRLYAELPNHLKPMAALAISTGLRRANVTHLEWSQVDLTRRVAWIHADQAKSSKPIGVPLSDEAVAVLRGQLGQHDRWVFPTRVTGRDENGKPRLGPQAQISTGWNAALIRAGIDVITEPGQDGKLIKKSTFRWHDLRHTWASWHVMSGTPLEVLQKLGGWASLTMVMRYAHLAPEYLAGYAGNAKPPAFQAEKSAA